MKRFLPKEALWPYQDNPYWLLHATSPIPEMDIFDYRVNLLALQTETVFGCVPDNIEEFVTASQICQAEGLKFIIERFRSQMWRRTGVIWWNMIDGWPQFSDAVVDYYFEKKLAFNYVSRSQTPLCLMIREDIDSSLHLVAANDSRIDFDLEFVVTDVGSGRIITRGSAASAADSALELDTVPCAKGAAGMFRIVWTGEKASGVNHFLYGKPPFDLATYQQWLHRAYEAISSAGDTETLSSRQSVRSD
jgi:beta-mannosidase